MFERDDFAKLQLKINKTQDEMNDYFMKQIKLLTDLAENYRQEMRAMQERINELEAKLENKKRVLTWALFFLYFERRDYMHTWERGRFTVDDTKFIFEARVHDKPVKFGIYGGPISILMIAVDDGSEEQLFKDPIVYYDREWLVEPDGNPTYEKALAHILERYNQEGE